MTTNPVQNTPFMRRVKATFLGRSKSGLLKLKLKLGLTVKLKYDDRHVLEDLILPELSETSHNVLFVGCEYYTKFYRNFFKNAEYWTIEIDPEKVRWGAGDRHIIDGLQNIAEHFSESSLDLIICNGVYGWGLDQKQDIESAIDGCHQVLKPGGLFVFGWNKIPERTPVSLDSIQAFKKFDTFRFDKLNTASHQCRGDLNHTFNFYQKPGAN